MSITIVRKESSRIKEEYLGLKEKNPQIRARDAAGQIGISEAELVASRLGEGVTRLVSNWKEMLPAIKAFGKVMGLTRNEYAVHERKGIYDNATIDSPHSIFVNPDIDLRIFLSHWQFAFAVNEETKSGLRHSLQFFDKDGSAVHKVYLEKESDMNAYQEYVSKFKADDQSPKLDIQPYAPKKSDRPDSEIDLKEFRTAWEGLQDTHDFFPMLMKYKIGRVQALRLIGEDLAYKVSNVSFRKLLNIASERKCEIMIFVGNTGCIQIHTGLVSNLKEFGTWYNVLDPDFNLHLREDAVMTSWVVKKPTKDGVVTSLELFDKDNQNIALLFGKRKPGIPELVAWREIINELEKI